MAFKRKNKYKSDDFVANDDDDDNDSGAAPPSKRGKTTGTDFHPSTGAQTDSEGNKYWELSKARRVTVSGFKGKTLINIREYYQADGKWLPGKKGIGLTIDQYSAIMSIVPQIEEVLREKGEKVSRPSFDDAATVKDQDDDEEDEEDNDEKEAKKANIEATSDEDE